MWLTQLVIAIKTILVDSFLHIYTNIYGYTRHKHHTKVNWLRYLLESRAVVGNSTFLLVVFIIYLFFEGLILNLIINLREFVFNIPNFFKLTEKSIVYKIQDLILNWFYNPFLNWRFFLYIQKSTLRNQRKQKFLIRNFFALPQERFTYDELVSYFKKSKFWYYVIIVFYSFIKSTIVSLLVGVIVAFYMLFFFSIQPLKQVALWFIILNLFFWLMSGFNFFLKRYKFGKFTSAIQRFWKRANMCFWLVEGFLFLLFYYYFLNSSQEPIYMADYSSLNQEYLLSPYIAYRSLILISLLVFIGIYLTLAISYLTLSQSFFFLSIMSFLVFKIFYVESYQFYYLISTFSEGSWAYLEDSNEWKYLSDSPRMRTKQYYFFMCLIAKYWHFMFIFISWIFFLMKIYEAKRIRFTLLAYNLQNMIILYVLNLLTYSQWIKWYLHRFFESIYFWFYTNYDYKSIEMLIREVLLVVDSIFYINLSSFDIRFFNCILYSNKLYQVGDNFFYHTFLYFL